MKYRKAVIDIGLSSLTLIIFKTLLWLTPIERSRLISSLWESRMRVLFLAPFGRPRIFPIAGAAENPYLVRSLIISRSVCANREIGCLSDSIGMGYLHLYTRNHVTTFGLRVKHHPKNGSLLVLR